MLDLCGFARFFGLETEIAEKGGVLQVFGIFVSKPLVWDHSTSVEKRVISSLCTIQINLGAYLFTKNVTVIAPSAAAIAALRYCIGYEVVQSKVF